MSAPALSGRFLPTVRLSCEGERAFPLQRPVLQVQVTAVQLLGAFIRPLYQSVCLQQNGCCSTRDHRSGSRTLPVASVWSAFMLRDRWQAKAWR